MRPFSTHKFKVGTEAWQRFYAGFLLRRNLPWVLAGAAVVAILAYVDFRLGAAALILLAGLFPFAWILVLSRFMAISENRRNLLTMKVDYDPGGSLTLTRWLPDAEGAESDERVEVVTYPSSHRLWFGASGGYLTIRGEKLHLIIPMSAIMR